jgi:lysophospholipase L1-like esterase
MHKIIIYNFLIFFIVVVIAEIFTGIIFFNKNKIDCLYLQCNESYIMKDVRLHNTYTNYNVLYSKDKFGFRGRKNSLNNIDILTVGGSTTDERYLKLEDTWSQQLEKRLNKKYPNLDVVNAGIDGQSTNGHIWNFLNWFNKIDNFKTKYIIFYIGINEILYEQNKFNQNIFDNEIDISELNFFKKIKFFLKKNNGLIFKTYKSIKKVSSNDEYNVGHNPLRNLNKYQEPIENFSILLEKEYLFRDNLNKLYKYTRDLNSIPIFITQKTLRGTKNNDIILSISKEDYFSYEKRIAKIIINFCFKKNLFCIDLNEELNFIETDFYDLVHTSPKGSEKIAEYIFQNIHKRISFH